jgi:hypothetical protein
MANGSWSGIRGFFSRREWEFRPADSRQSVRGRIADAGRPIQRHRRWRGSAAFQDPPGAACTGPGWKTAGEEEGLGRPASFFLFTEIVSYASSKKQVVRVFRRAPPSHALYPAPAGGSGRIRLVRSPQLSSRAEPAAPPSCRSLRLRAPPRARPGSCRDALLRSGPRAYSPLPAAALLLEAGCPGGGYVRSPGVVPAFPVSICRVA